MTDARPRLTVHTNPHPLRPRESDPVMMLGLAMIWTGIVMLATAGYIIWRWLT